ncbi:MAG TPA: DUF4238 domain-containing protein [Longimicrobium sp.]
MGKHYVPQKYLKGFAVPEDENLIWMYDKETRKWSRPAIKRVAQERDYFSEDVEKRLTTEIENPGNAVLDQLRAGGRFSPADRGLLENYITVMMMRVPRRRRKSFESFPSVRDSTIDSVRQEIAASVDKADPEVISNLLHEVDRLAELYATEIPESVIDEIHSPWPSEGILDAVRRMTWRLVPAPPALFFVTSDNPAFFFEAYGVGSPKAELTFPISTTLALLASHRGEPGATLVNPVRPAVFKEVNRRIISGAERFIFTRYKADWIEVVANKSNVYLSRIGW